ncbi:MAG: NHLP family bacteriocin export ABC transporter peptidase/permease/ATPase subunit [Lachnospiraceae bacterium]|nr:NHLP family bacteriocin export ABC transporter peptidase/permease/ATPase subunit [Lachnospiraceae bacterium]
MGVFDKSQKKEPVGQGRVAKVPIVMQLEALECGAASLCMILAYYGKWLPLEQVRKDCGVSRDGSNARNLLIAARSYGLKTDAYRFEPEYLKENGLFPSIIHWNFNHFVVLDGFKKNKAVLNDPARGKVEVSMEEFDESFTGVCMQFAPGEDFVPSGSQKSIWGFVKRKLTGTTTAIVFFVLTYILTSIFGIISPAFTRVFYDYLLTGRQMNWVVPFLTLYAAFVLLEIVLSIVQTLFSLRVEGKFDIMANSEYMWHVLRMPVEFFSQRLAGDIAMRKVTNSSITTTLIETIAPGVLNMVLIVVYFAILMKYSVILTFVGVGSILLNWALARYVADKEVNIQRVQMRDEGKLQSTTVSGIEMIETIKSSGAENGFFQRWAGFQASVNSQEVNFLRLSTWFSVLTSFLSQFTEMVILAIGFLLIFKGDFTPGILAYFRSLLESFSSPALSLITAESTIREMRTNMERIEDVLDYPVDVTEEQMMLKDDISYSKLTGKLEMRNVTFGYSPLAEPLIRDFNMTLESGKKVAFVGSSGCGKSTLVKLLSGLYRPWSGEILYDGVPMDQVDHNMFTGSVAVVDQDITLFEGSVAENIKMWDTSIEDFEMILAARDARLHEDILQRDGGYRYKMMEGGRDFSGGQRQRIEIARVLAQDPTIILMDEATSALDARTEYEVMQSIAARGITCVVVAHRLSTIRDCDEIIVMDHGVVVERGTHSELMANHGMYEELITSE